MASESAEHAGALGVWLGVVPLYTTTGASSASQREIGSGVFWGLVIGTPMVLSMVPVFYLIVRRLFSSRRQRARSHFEPGWKADQPMSIT